MKGQRFLNYKDALEYIHNTNKFGMKLGLDNMKNLLNILGNPQNKLKFIHIAGTNGKGSISAFLNSILINEGYRVGLFISPYLEEFTERIQINGEHINKEELVRLTHRVKKAIEVLLSKGYQHPTEFEIVTTIGLLYFYEQQVDLVILEVGLGGRLDATNIIPKSLVSIISSIGLDHTMYLGNSIEEVAVEKGGIIKEKGDIVLYPQRDNVFKVIEDIAQEKKANLYIVEKASVNFKEGTIEGQSFSYIGENLKLPQVEIKLLGRHQIYNGGTVLKAIEVLRKKGFRITNHSILEGFKKAQWPGRFEIISNNPIVILDGAHNPQGAKAFNKAIREYFPEKRIILFFGLLEDKDSEEILKYILPIAKEVITLTPNNPRAIEGKLLAEKIKQFNNCNKNCFQDIKVRSMDLEEVFPVINQINPDEIISFTGSLYLIGEIRRMWNYSGLNS